MKEYMVTVSKTGTCVVHAENEADAMLMVDNANVVAIQWDDWWEVTDAQESEL